ncbi:MAG: S1/P1 nuclease [Terriglobia bacterium]
MGFSYLPRLTRVGTCLGVLGAVFVVLLSPVRAWPWGCDGHQAVAMIAEKHMNAHALEMANKLLRREPIDPALSRYCLNQGLDLMADSSTWADDLRGSRPEASPWHYIDIPRGAPRSAIAESCPASTGCVTSAIEHQLEVLRSDGTDARTRADALRFVIHFVGDLHQPLHCVSNNDLGGNCVPIDFFGDASVEKNPQYESYAPNLHGIWDSAIIQRMRGTETVAQWAAALDRQFSSHASRWEKQGINVDTWAWESHELADSVVYAKLPVAIPVETPMTVKGCSDDDHVSTRMLKLHEQVSQPYVDAVAPTINQQIAKAGVRLAMVLNQIWP